MELVFANNVIYLENLCCEMMHKSASSKMMRKTSPLQTLGAIVRLLQKVVKGTLFFFFLQDSSSMLESSATTK